MRRARRVGLVLLWGMVSLAGPLCSSAGESLTIAALLADPSVYHMKTVTLRGTVSQVQILVDPPNPNPQLDYQMYYAHPPYTFVLADDTGFLQIVAKARPPYVPKSSSPLPPDVEDGDTVVIEVWITVAHDDSGATDRPPIQALLRSIQQGGQ